MRTSKLITLATLILAGSVHAQVMYRCGNSFSQQPCGQGQQEIATSGVQQPVARPVDDKPATAQTLAAAQRMCEAAIIARLKDPDSAKFQPVRRRNLTRAADGTTMRDYTVYVNAKNSMGGYAGAASWRCSLDADETGVVEVSPPITR